MQKVKKLISRTWKFIAESFVNANEWLKGLGVATFLIGFIGTITIPEMFWMSVSFCCVGFVVLVLDVLLDEKLFFRVKLVLIGSATAFVIYFGISFVFVPANLGILSTVLINPPDMPNPIPWNKNFSALQINFYNESKIQFNDIVLVVKTTEPVTGATILAGPQDANLRPIDVDPPLISALNEHGELIAHVPLVLVATDAGYIVRCANLLPGERLSVLLAVSRTHWDGSATKPAAANQNNQGGFNGLLDSDYLMSVPYRPGYHQFFGHTNYDRYQPPHWPFSVLVSGSYIAEFRKRNVSFDREPMSELEALRQKNLIH